MERYDEKSIAEKMHDTQSFIKGFTVGELSIYAKWLKYNEIIKLKNEYSFDDLTQEELDKIDLTVEANLIDFSSKHYGGFNYNLDYKKIDAAMERSRQVKLRLPIPIPITKKEWQIIQTAETENQRRVLLIMLIDAKYNRYNSISLKHEVKIDNSTVFYMQMKKGKQILDAAGVKKISEEERKSFFANLRNQGFCGITDGRKNVRYINFVDIDSSEDNVLDYIEDYSHLELYYDKFLNSDKIGVCKICGKLFRQNKNKTAQYCTKHRKYNKKNFSICADCGKEFIVAPNKIRCDDCQRKKHLADMRNWRNNSLM